MDSKALNFTLITNCVGQPNSGLNCLGCALPRLCPLVGRLKLQEQALSLCQLMLLQRVRSDADTFILAIAGYMLGS